MKNILILGGAGFLGANLVRRCLNEPDVNITVIDSLDEFCESTMDNLRDVEDKIDFIKGDIRDVDLMNKKLEIMKENSKSCEKTNLRNCF